MSGIGKDDLKELRTQEGLGHAAFAEKISSKPVTIYKYESGEVVPSTFALAKMAKELNVTFEITPKTLDDHPVLSKKDKKKA